MSEIEILRPARIIHDANAAAFELRAAAERLAAIRLDRKIAGLPCATDRTARELVIHLGLVHSRLVRPPHALDRLQAIHADLLKQSCSTPGCVTCAGLVGLPGDQDREEPRVQPGRCAENGPHAPHRWLDATDVDIVVPAWYDCPGREAPGVQPGVQPEMTDREFWQVNGHLLDP